MPQIQRIMRMFLDFCVLCPIHVIRVKIHYFDLTTTLSFIQVNINYLTDCHPERSEGSRFSVAEMLRYAQHDMAKSQPIKVKQNKSRKKWVPSPMKGCHCERSEAISPIVRRLLRHQRPKAVARNDIKGVWFQNNEKNNGFWKVTAKPSDKNVNAFGQIFLIMCKLSQMDVGRQRPRLHTPYLGKSSN